MTVPFLFLPPKGSPSLQWVGLAFPDFCLHNLPPRRFSRLLCAVCRLEAYLAGEAQSGVNLYVLLALAPNGDFSSCAPISFSVVLEVGGGVQVVSLPPEGRV